MTTRSKTKITMIWALMAAVCTLCSAVPITDTPAVRRTIRLSKETAAFTKVNIALREQTQLLKFAAGELRDLLQKAGVSATVAAGAVKETPGVLNIVLGARNGEEKKLPLEGFVIRKVKNTVYIYGRDSKQEHPAQNRFSQWYERSTLTGVYDFLERFAGIRFYFPGDFGTYIPRRNKLVLPEKIDIMESPDKRLRFFSYFIGKWPEGEVNNFKGVKGTILNILRLRFTEYPLAYSHGLAHLGFIRRYAKSHPEYFALMEDGKRYCQPGMPHTGQLCFSSGIREEIYRDMVSAFRGEPASKRQVRGFAGNSFIWNPKATFSSGLFCVMPQDWMFWCCCAKCAKIAPGGRAALNQEKYHRAVNEFIWNMTAEFANRLKKDKIKGTVMQMSYPPYELIPQCKIPDNVRVLVALTGDEKVGDERLRMWNKKTGTKPLIWTYPGKHMAKAVFDGIPPMGGVREGLWYKEHKDLHAGANRESETDYLIFNHLDDYVFSRLMWNGDADVHQIRKEYFDLMFGPAAKEIEKFYGILEELWHTRIIGRKEQDELGPVVRVPSLDETWKKIYSPARFKEFDRIFNKAEKLTAARPEALKRVRYIRKHILDVMKYEAHKYLSSNTLFDHWYADVPGKVWLRSTLKTSGKVPETSVEIKDKGNALEFTFFCGGEKDPVGRAAQNDSGVIFADSHVELFLNPSGDRKNYYQIALSASGKVYDMACVKDGKKQIPWQGNIKGTVIKEKDGWKAVLLVPKKSLGAYNAAGFPVNFGRTITGGAHKRVLHFQWSPVPVASFHDIDKYGILRLQKKNTQLIVNGDFAGDGKPWRFWRQHPAGQTLKPDGKEYVSGRSSLLLENRTPGKIMNATQIIPLKPGRRYRLSYDIKMDLKKGAGKNFGANAVLCQGLRGYKAISFPMPRLRGKCDWKRLSFEFTSDSKTDPKEARLVLWLWGDTGTVRYDRVSLEDVTNK